MPVHKNGEMLQVKVEQVQKGLAVANHKPPAKSPIDIVHDAFHSLTLFPAAGARDEPGSPFAGCQEFHIVTRGGFPLEYVRQVEINPRKMLGVKWIFIDRIRYKLDFHIHQTEKEERIFHHISGGG